MKNTVELNKKINTNNKFFNIFFQTHLLLSFLSVFLIWWNSYNINYMGLISHSVKLIS